MAGGKNSKAGRGKAIKSVREEGEGGEGVGCGGGSKSRRISKNFFFSKNNFV